MDRAFTAVCAFRVWFMLHHFQKSCQTALIAKPCSDLNSYLNTADSILLNLVINWGTISTINIDEWG